MLAGDERPVMYEAVIPIRVALSDPEADLGDAIGAVTDQLALVDESTPELVDYAVSSDAEDGTALFEITVDAADDLQALAAAVSWVRTAIHATGGDTPGWTLEGSASVAILTSAAR
jgi:hypothetical protein